MHGSVPAGPDCHEAGETNGRPAPRRGPPSQVSQRRQRRPPMATRLRRASRAALLLPHLAVVVHIVIAIFFTRSAVASQRVAACEGVTAAATSSSASVGVPAGSLGGGGRGLRGRRRSSTAFAHPSRSAAAAAAGHSPLTVRPAKRRPPGHLCAAHDELGAPPPSTEEGAESAATSAVLRISYDGSHFHGWSAANHDHDDVVGNDYDDLARLATPGDFFSSQRRSRRNRRKHLTGPGEVGKKGKGRVRTVEGTIRACVAKIYGNVDRARVRVVGCSRTDRGVHSRATVAQVFCLRQDIFEATSAARVDGGHNRTSPGDGFEMEGGEFAVAAAAPSGGVAGRDEDADGGIPRHPLEDGDRDGLHNHHHPTSVHDPNFEPLPFGGNLSQLVYVLNRMLPPDISVTDICLPPASTSSDAGSAAGNKAAPIHFHPTLCTKSKTYRYTFAVPHSGNDSGRGVGGGGYLLYDPIRWRHVWHVNSASGFDWDRAREAAGALVGTNDYSSFRGAYRGSERKDEGAMNKSPVCTVTGIVVRPEEGLLGAGVGGFGPGAATYGTIDITGDRFLYKMCRFLVGAVVFCGTGGGLTVDRVREALHPQPLGNGGLEENTHGRRKPGLSECAPAHGLMLQDVSYGEEWNFHWLLRAGDETGAGMGAVVSKE